MATLLEAAGKSEIARQEFSAVLTREAKVVTGEAWRRLSGLHTVRGVRNLAVARELWEARDKFAREIDTSPGRLVPDSSLVAAAKAMPESRHGLASLREFSGRASRSELPRWWAAVEMGRTTEDLPAVRVTSDAMPPPRVWSDRNPEADKRLKAARAAITVVSTEARIPVENLLTPELLRRIAWTPPEPLEIGRIRSDLVGFGAREWQVEAVAEVILDAFVDADQPIEPGVEPVS